MIRKTAAITAASIAGVVLAGGAAIGANIGILNAADDDSLGTLSATAITAPAMESLTSTAETADAKSSNIQSFAVDAAGIVDLAVTDQGLQLIDVRPNDGWTWSEMDGGDGSISVSFASATDSLEFAAARNPDGTIAALVDRPAAPMLAAGYEEHDEYEEYEDDEEHEEGYEEHEDEEEHEEEGGQYEEEEEDDDHEYEGRDDDD